MASSVAKLSPDTMTTTINHSNNSNNKGEKNNKRSHSTASSSISVLKSSSSYYDMGSSELAIETPVMLQRLEKRRRLTGSGANDGAELLLIVLVGLPARGKSFIARKLLNCITWRGNQCRIFNVGKYRRRLAKHNDDDDDKEKDKSTTCKADFFDDSNQQAAKMRQAAAELALEETLNWLETGNTTEQQVSTIPPSSSLLSLGSQQSSDSGSSSSSSSSVDVTSGLESHSARRQYHRIAIFDATNSTQERRRWILKECAKRTEKYQQRRQQESTNSIAPNNTTDKRIGVLFLESICDDPELLAENFRVKIGSCPDFGGMTPDEAMEDLKTRIRNYEARYEPIPEQAHESYIKIYNLSSRVVSNHVYGRLAKVVLPAIMAWNTGSRPVFLCRAGETKAMEAYMKRQQQMRKQQQQQQQDNDEKTQPATSQLEALEMTSAMKRKRSDRLGERGLRFRDALCEFIEKEGMEFMSRRNDTFWHPSKMDTGTSISGLYEERDHPMEHSASSARRGHRHHPKRVPTKQQQQPPVTAGEVDAVSVGTNNTAPSFPCLVMSSTMPRAVETATWKQNPFPVKDVSNLNPLDMGDFAGMDLATIREQHPEWYEQLQREPFFTRFPGGESYSDLIDRLYSVVIDMEQQLGLALVVSHVSVLQVLVSYFRSTPIRECMDIEIPMHTVLKFTPLRGGGWLESQHALLPDDIPEQTTTTSTKNSNMPASSAVDDPEPIWGDSRSCLPQKLSS